MNNECASDNFLIFVGHTAPLEWKSLNTARAILTAKQYRAAGAKERRPTMIQNTQELEAILARIRRFQRQVEKLREVETNSRNYELSADGFLVEIDRMKLEVRAYLSIHLSELIKQITEGST